MPIKRFYPIKDNTITNAKKVSENVRAKEANMGQSDSLEVFRLSGSTDEGTREDEESRIILKFDAAEISSSAENMDFPLNDTEFYLRLYNVKHGSSVPSSYNLEVSKLESDFTEGYGLDMETYKDEGVSNWLSSSEGQGWTEQGGGDLSSIGSQTFNKGTEDLFINITSEVSSSWCNGSLNDSSGSLIIYLPEEYDQHYTKKFSSRTTNYFFKRPSIEARWESVVQDNSNNLYKRSTRLSAEDNAQEVYFYNWVGDELKQLSEGEDIYFYVYASADSSTSDFSNKISLGNADNPSTGVYKFNVPGQYLTGSYLHYGLERGSDVFLNKSVELKDRESKDNLSTPDYNITIRNLKSKYDSTETANMRLSIKDRDRDLNIYTTAQSNFDTDVIDKIYYKIIRRADDLEVIPYGDGRDGTPEFTKLSYDSDGNYFDLDMSLLEPGFMYEVSFLYKTKNQYVEYRNSFKFRVE